MLGQRGWQDNRWKLVEKGKKPTSLNGIRDFIRNRRAEMMKEIASGMPIWIAAPGAPPIIKDGDKVKGEKDDKSHRFTPPRPLPFGFF